MKAQAGFSLLEVLVAFVIMAMALGALYHSLAGSVRSIGIVEQYSHAMVLARSLLDQYDQLPPEGLDHSGVTDEGYRWHLVTSPVLDTRLDQDGFREDFHAITATVEWSSLTGSRSVALKTALPIRGRGL